MNFVTDLNWKTYLCTCACGIISYYGTGHTIVNWAIPFNKGTPPMDDFSVSVPGAIDMLGYLRILL